jgi:hypothetical protein
VTRTSTRIIRKTLRRIITRTARLANRDLEPYDVEEPETLDDSLSDPKVSELRLLEPRHLCGRCPRSAKLIPGKGKTGAKVIYCCPARKTVVKVVRRTVTRRITRTITVAPVGFLPIADCLPADCDGSIATAQGHHSRTDLLW